MLGDARAGRDRRAAAGLPVPGRHPDALSPGGGRPGAVVFFLAVAFFAPLVELHPEAGGMMVLPAEDREAGDGRPAGRGPRARCWPRWPCRP